MENQTERTIYFKDLLFAVLYRWRAVLAAMLIGAVLLGGMELLGASDKVTLNSVSVTPENQIKIDQYQNTLEVTETLIESHTAYLDESVLMTLDSYAAYTAGLYVSVAPAGDTDAPHDQAAAILYAYRTALMDTAVMDELAKKLDMEPVYLKELITPEVTNTGVLNVFVRGRSLEEAEEVAAFLKVTLEAQSEQVAQTIEDHKLHVSSFSSGPVIDKALYDLQNTARQRLTTLKNTVTNTTTELNKLLPTQLTAGKPNPVLFAIVGAFLGAFLMVVIACVAHIGSGKVYSARTLKDRTNLRILGRVCGKKRNPIDCWLRKLEGRAVHTQPDAIVANIKNRCTEGKKLLVFGAENAAKIRPLVEQLVAAGVPAKLCAAPAGSAEAIEALPDFDAAVLVETCGESSYDDVIWTVETVEEYEKTLLGCVLIDG